MVTTKTLTHPLQYNNHTSRLWTHQTQIAAITILIAQTFLYALALLAESAIHPETEAPYLLLMLSTAAVLIAFPSLHILGQKLKVSVPGGASVEPYSERYFSQWPENLKTVILGFFEVLVVIYFLGLGSEVYAVFVWIHALAVLALAFSPRSSVTSSQPAWRRPTSFIRVANILTALSIMGAVVGLSQSLMVLEFLPWSSIIFVFYLALILGLPAANRFFRKSKGTASEGPHLAGGSESSIALQVLDYFQPYADLETRQRWGKVKDVYIFTALLIVMAAHFILTN